MWRFIATISSFVIICVSLNSFAEVERFVLLYTIAPQKESLLLKVKNAPQSVEIKGDEASPFLGLSPEFLLKTEYEAAQGWQLIFTNIDDAYFDGHFNVNGLSQSVLIEPKGHFTLPVGVEGKGEIKGYSNQPPEGLGSENAEREFLPPTETPLDTPSQEDSY